MGKKNKPRLKEGTPPPEAKGPSFFIGELVPLKGGWFRITGANTERLVLDFEGLRKNGKPEEAPPAHGETRIDVPNALADKLAQAGLKAGMDEVQALMVAISLFHDTVMNPPPVGLIDELTQMADRGNPLMAASIRQIADTPGVRELATIESAAREGVGVIRPMTDELRNAITSLNQRAGARGGVEALEAILGRPGFAVIGPDPRLPVGLDGLQDRDPLAQTLKDQLTAADRYLEHTIDHPDGKGPRDNDPDSR